MIILGIDPGYAIVGYGLIRYERAKFEVLHYGAITTAAKQPFEERLKIIHEGMCYLLDNFHPQAMAIERLYFTSNQKTAIDVAQARGVMLLSAIERQVPIFEYTPLQVKQAVVGYGKAVKKQVMEMTRMILHLKEVPKPDDTADALAIAICHAHSAGSRLRML
ncbi:crossover junction endodeoxyribonuclease RuvC [Candidatus Soleaferrea massiliensis]|uniref:crossover junction endodeoxyribonuclease RuvC n=1 Tax=Candidatus Soleaferrea massiliensis TaxID=1470354 RepID=UPI0005913FC8|nr:crossover junction endodeoxyribonuclease RuvC [Candidatus Soleaferrea massiliensis]